MFPSSLFTWSVYSLTILIGFSSVKLVNYQLNKMFDKNKIKMDETVVKVRKVKFKSSKRRAVAGKQRKKQHHHHHHQQQQANNQGSEPGTSAGGAVGSSLNITTSSSLSRSLNPPLLAPRCSLFTSSQSHETAGTTRRDSSSRKQPTLPTTPTSTTNLEMLFAEGASGSGGAGVVARALGSGRKKSSEQVYAKNRDNEDENDENYSNIRFDDIYERVENEPQTPGGSALASWDTKKLDEILVTSAIADAPNADEVSSSANQPSSVGLPLNQSTGIYTFLFIKFLILLYLVCYIGVCIGSRKKTRNYYGLDY